MRNLIAVSIDRSRTVLSLFLLILVSGAITFSNIPKESNPDVPIPVFYISIVHEGISPEDAERLLLRPMERQLKSLDGLKNLSAVASEGHASVTLEFNAGIDGESTMAKVRDAVTIGRAKLPSETEEPTITEITMESMQPALTVMLYGEVPEQTLYAVARNFRDQLEGFVEINEVKMNGYREEVLEVVIDPKLLESYDVSLNEIFSLVSNNNRLVAAGTLDSGAGMFAVKVPGIIKNFDDISTIPVKVNDDRVVTFADVAEIRQSYKDAKSFARLNGKPAVSLEIVKQPGENTIETVEKVKTLINRNMEYLPGGVQVAFTGDTSKDIKMMLNDLTNNVLSAVLLVAIIILAFLGTRNAILVGIAIPGSFLTGILVLSLFGITVNVVVLFALIMSVGMLVDGAIVVTEYADRRMSEGVDKTKAYREASQRMAWPITASTATTLAAFMPLLFWPDMMGEFMKYLPMTLIAVLSASLIMALICVPTVGGIFGKPRWVSETEKRNMLEAEEGSLEKITGLSARYLSILSTALDYPFRVLMLAILILIGSYVGFFTFGKGAIFFPDIEPPFTTIKVKAIGDLSIYEKDELVRRVEAIALEMDSETTSVFTKTFTSKGSDTIGTIKLNFKDWDKRRPANDIIAELEGKLAKLPGVHAQIEKFKDGPQMGKPVQIQLMANSEALLVDSAEKLQNLLRQVGGFTDIESSSPVPGLEWQLKVNREKAAQFGADIAQVGMVVPLVTTGVKIAEYRPDHLDEEVDIRVRYGSGSRHLDTLDLLRVRTDRGLVPISNFVTREPAKKVDVINRIDAARAITVTADVAPGAILPTQFALLMEALEKDPLNPLVKVRVKGESEEQEKSMAFLGNAFSVALFIMAVILVTQFNSFYQAFLILTAVIFSTAGVFLGLLIMGKPFGTIMSGIGIISLAGIIVNNNIVLIDTYNVLRQQGFPVIDAIKRTGVQRLRPVLLTTATTVIGLMPMVFQVNIDIMARDVSVGAPSTQWWTQLASAVAGGLTFATFLTLILTPTLLLIGHHVSRKLGSFKLVESLRGLKFKSANS